MMFLLKVLLFVLCFQWSYLSDPSWCEIELECPECLPENMPLVRSPPPGGNATLQLPPGAQLALDCPGGSFLLYPLHSTLHAACEGGGRFRVQHDRQARDLLQLGCQESVFEDVLHDVPHCAPPLQGRAYRVRGSGASVTHLATACFDPDAGVARVLHALGGAALPLAPHSERAAPLSLLGNFEHMFDASTRHAAERLYADEARLNRRLHRRFEPERYTFAEQTLGSASLVARGYFPAALGGAAEFVSSRVAVWRSVAAGNLRHAQRDVARAVRRAPGTLHVYAGTLDVLTLAAGRPRPALYLGAARRFPVPRYVWTALHAPGAARGVALVVLNDPLVAVSEVRDAVFCESACGSVTWLRELTRHRNYERPVNGLAFCCPLRDLAARVPELPPIFNDTTALLVDID